MKYGCQQLHISHIVLMGVENSRRSLNMVIQILISTEAFAEGTLSLGALSNPDPFKLLQAQGPHTVSFQLRPVVLTNITFHLSAQPRLCISSSRSNITQTRSPRFFPADLRPDISEACPEQSRVLQHPPRRNSKGQMLI